MFCVQVMTIQDVAVALNTRKLWCMHIRAQWKVLSEALRCVCGTSCPPLLAMLRRMCIQLADLSSPSATLTIKTLLDLLLEELQPWVNNTHAVICVDAWKCVMIVQTVTAGRKARRCAGDRPYASCLWWILWCHRKRVRVQHCTCSLGPC